MKLFATLIVVMVALAPAVAEDACYINDRDIPGGDLYKVRNKSWSECKRICAADSRCKGLNYGTSSFKNRNCYIKGYNYGGRRLCLSCRSATLPCEELRTSCLSGQYRYNDGKYCATCSSGTYSSGGKASSCSSCPPGTYSGRGARLCTNCPAGQYNSRSKASSCSSCPSGQYSHTGARSCTQCPAGQYNSRSGASSCIRCPANSYCSVGARNYTACPSGTRSEEGASSCLIVDGGWSEFGSWTGCSAKCGGGTQQRSRSCNKPSPANGGAKCNGNDKETKTCNPNPCPVDGGWSKFGYWSLCSVGCGGGNQTRTKTCDNPAPKYGGSNCVGAAKETQSCNKKPCSTSGWIAAGVRTKLIQFDTKSQSLQIQTDSEVGSGDLLWMQFVKHNANKNHRGIRISFEKPPRFMIGSCTSWADAKFPPSCANKNRVWTITKKWGTVQLYCNGGQIFDFDYTSTKSEYCRNHWSVKTAHIRFVMSDTSSDSYRPLPKICTGLPDSWIGVTTKTQFPVNHGTIIKVSCQEGYVNTGSEVVTCNNNLNQDFDYDTKPLCSTSASREVGV